MLWSVAYAQAGEAAARPSILESMFPMILAFAVIYFLIIRPQGKKMKDQTNLRSQLKKGDQVITTSGILGRIEGVADQILTLEISEGVRVKVLRSSVAGLQAGLLKEK